MSKIKCCKIAHIFEIQHGVLYRRIDAWLIGPKTWNTTFLQTDQILQLLIFDIAPNLLTLHPPPP